MRFFSKTKKQSIVTDGLVLYLDAGIQGSYPGSGTTWTDLAGSNNGTLTNGPTFGSANGGSIVFDGVDDYVEVGSFNDPRDKTYSFWVFRPASGEEQFFSVGNSSYTCLGITFNSTRDGNSQIAASYGAYGDIIFFGFGILSGLSAGWLSCTLTTNSSGEISAFYVNATPTSSISQNSRIDRFEDTFRLGIRSLGTFPFGENIAIVKVYNRALSATEVAQNFEATRNRFGI